MFSAAPISGLRYFSGGRQQQRSVRIRSRREHKVCDLCQVHGGVAPFFDLAPVAP